MYEGNTVGVVVPAYNEEGFVGEVIDTVPEFVDRVYVVDDQSTDGTWREIRDHAAEENRTAAEGRAEAARPAAELADSADSTIADGGLATARRVVPIRHDENRGVGGAIKTGYQRAYEDGMDVTAVMAGDGQMDPDQLSRLLDPIVDRGADYAKGNRLLDTEFREEMPRFRLFGNWLLSVLTKIASGYWHTGDPQNGYTAISYRALDRLDLADLYDEYGFANELLVRLNQHDVAVADVAMPAVYGDEESTIQYRTFIPCLSKLLFVSFCRRLWTQTAEYGDRTTTCAYGLGTFGLVTAALFGVGLLGGRVGGFGSFGEVGSLGGFGLLGALLVGSLTTLAVAAILDATGNRHLEMRVSGEAEGSS